MTDMTLPGGARLIIDRLHQHGHRGDAVGGCVRDFLLGRPCNDYDIATDATPSVVKAIFSDLRTIDTGIQHGTVTVIADGESFEVTTYRIDGDYVDNRHPESVSFTSEIADDLSRRDFTVNAMAYNPYYGYTDLFGGVEDLAAKIIRAVGDPTTRFSEDALRILRAIRFAATLGFEIDPATAAAARSEQGRLSSVSVERIYVEISKLLAGKSAHRVLSDYPDIIETALSISPTNLPDRERFVRAGYMARLTSIFYLNGKGADDFSLAMRRLKTDNRTRLIGESVLALYDSAAVDTDSDLLSLAQRGGKEVAGEVIDLGILLGRFAPEHRLRLDSLLDEGRAYRISDLKVGGNDLLSLGIKGKEIGSMLDLLLDLVIAERLENTKDALIAFVKDRTN